MALVVVTCLQSSVNIPPPLFMTIPTLQAIDPLNGLSSGRPSSFGVPVAHPDYNRINCIQEIIISVEKCILLCIEEEGRRSKSVETGCGPESLKASV